ncbi:hypothetical protein Glove_437g26 [Diversispora epigaea]|uniref:Uncharacterized protein n=1 Tax=Diversispora epigaea TaxID=1348612 RepID=A0A397GS13_9GLOM|nr:hypothetical protein Glove_437g26 [Diversispora epigaea]
MTQKARTIYILFNGIEKDKIEYITYSVDSISSLTGTQIKNIINLYIEELDVKVSSSEFQKLIGVKNSSHTHNQPKFDIETKVCEETLTEVSTVTAPFILLSPISNSEDKINEKDKCLLEAKDDIPIEPSEFSEIVNVIDGFSDSNSNGSEDDNEDEFLSEKDKSLPETKVSTPFNPVHAHANFCNKTLEQYPDIFYEYNNEGVDYYGINAETLCPICKLNHENEEGVEDNYEAGSYYIKCEVAEIDIIQYINSKTIV